MKIKLITLLFCITTGIQVAQNNADFKVFKPSEKGSRNLNKLLESLIGEGVVLKNYSITKTSGEEAFGFFEDSKERLGMKKGLVMTTGGITSLSSKNTSPSTSNNTHERVENRLPTNKTSGYAELEKLINGKKTFDACVIELDIVPTADTLSFNYVFGSEEYDEFVGSNYNDVFAFFISGKGIEGEQNLAVVPNSDVPVSVNSINNGGNSSYKARPSNPTYYVSNMDGKIGIEYDGMTKLMQIKHVVIPYETYHIKLAIADAGDDAYDSGVFIEGKSFVSYKKTYQVLYAKNNKEIDAPFKTLLNNLSKEYKQHPNHKILITGHTDEEGDAEFNMNLSCERAKLVAAYLINTGVPENQLVVDCKGEAMPEYDNTNEKGKQLNRRVELKLSGNANDYAKKKDAESANLISAGKKSGLIKNFPNPFSRETTLEAFIDIDIKQASIVITDLLGKHVKTIYVIERQNTTINFDAQGLVKGIYSATLLVDNVSAGSLKLLLE